MRQWIAENVDPEITQVAKEHRHTVMFISPHHSDLLPIGLVWAKVKGTTSRAYSKDTKFNYVNEL